MKPGPNVLLSRRRCVAAALGAAAFCANPALASIAGAVVPLEDPRRQYSKRAVALVERSLIIDMLGPLKLDQRPEAFTLVATAPDLDKAKEKHRIAVIMGLQNADEFRTPQDVKKFHQLGLRCAQLTYNTQNLI